MYKLENVQSYRWHGDLRRSRLCT